MAWQLCYLLCDPHNEKGSGKATGTAPACRAQAQHRGLGSRWRQEPSSPWNVASVHPQHQLGFLYPKGTSGWVSPEQ